MSKINPKDLFKYGRMAKKKNKYIDLSDVLGMYHWEKYHPKIRKWRYPEYVKTFVYNGVDTNVWNVKLLPFIEMKEKVG